MKQIRRKELVSNILTLCMMVGLFTSMPVTVSAATIESIAQQQ